MRNYRFPRLFLALSLFVISYALIVINCSAEETLTITTYYPSPYGSYNQLTTYSSTNLAVNEGNVGIGTTNPTRRLTIQSSGIRSANSQYLYLRQPDDYGYSFNLDDLSTGRMYIKGVNGGVETDLLTLDRSSGNVGIGTPNPIQAKLEINTTDTALKTPGSIRLGEYESNSGGALYFDSYPASFITTADSSDVNSLLISSGFHLSLRTRNLPGVEGKIGFYPGDGNALRGQMGYEVFWYNGNVGIGTNVPVGAQLVINGTSAPNDIGGLDVIAPGSATGTVSITSPQGVPGIVGYANNGNRRDIRFEDRPGIGQGNGISLLTSPNANAPSRENGIIIDESGYVGIGTAIPNAKLDVNGDIAKQGTIIYGVVAGGLCLNGKEGSWDPKIYLYGGATCSGYHGGYDPGFSPGPGPAILDCPAGATKWITYAVTNNNSGGEGGICIK